MAEPQRNRVWEETSEERKKANRTALCQQDKRGIDFSVGKMMVTDRSG